MKKPLRLTPAMNRLLIVALGWQRHNCRDIPEALDKVEEEIDEWRLASALPDQLDELGDIVVSALRAVTRLSSDELEFLVRVMEMKVARRTGDSGVKDKEAEAEELAALAKEFL